MTQATVDPESHLRALAAEMLTHALRGQPLHRGVASLQAVAHAFVMLGLLPEARANAILAAHKAALADKGLKTRGFELTVRSGSAHGYWDALRADGGELATIPLSTAVGRIRCRSAGADIYLDWITLTPSGVRLQARVVYKTGSIPQAALQHIGPGEALSGVSVVDNTGQRYRLAFGGGVRSHRSWQGEIVVEPKPRSHVTWLEFKPADPGGTARVALPAPPSVRVGKADPQWPTPAESYLDALARVSAVTVNGVRLEAHDVAEVVAAVADGLLALGVLPAASPLLQKITDGQLHGWRTSLMHRWTRRLHQFSEGFLPGEQLALAVRLPLEHATAVIEWLSVHENQVCLQLYGHPWVMGEYWPVTVPCFELRATDAAGISHQAMPATRWRGHPQPEGSGDFIFWPPIATGMRHLRVIVSTLWEAAWADLELPEPRPFQDHL
jgi:hypothetical protein